MIFYFICFEAKNWRYRLITPHFHKDISLKIDQIYASLFIQIIASIDKIIDTFTK